MTRSDSPHTSSAALRGFSDAATRAGFTLAASVALLTTAVSIATVYLVLRRPLDLADALVEPRWTQVLSAIAGLVVAVVRDLIGYL